MYASADYVRALLTNKKSQTLLAEMASRAPLVDGIIDSKLRAAFYWPNDSDGNPIASTPSKVELAASYLTAALIERQTYFANVTEDGTQGSSYVTWLENQGNKILDGLIEGTEIDPGLVRFDIAKISRRTAPGGFEDSNPCRGRRYTPSTGLRLAGRRRGGD